VFGSPTPFRNAANKESAQAGKVRGSGQNGGKGGAAGISGARGKEQEGSGAASKGGRSFERVDYQNPGTFSVAEVSCLVFLVCVGVHGCGCIYRLGLA